MHHAVQLRTADRAKLRLAVPRLLPYLPTRASATGLQLEFHVDTAILGSIKGREAWKCWERGLTGQGS